MLLSEWNRPKPGIFQLKIWPDCYTELSPRLLPVLWGCKRMELIGTLQNPPQICTDYLHEAEFAQRNTLLFVWLILFGKGWRKLSGTALLLHAWTPTGFTPVVRNTAWKTARDAARAVGMWSCDSCVVWVRSAVLISGWELALCPGFPDVWQPGCNHCTCQRAGQNFSPEKKQKKKNPKKPTPNSDNWNESHSLLTSAEPP